MSLGATGKHQKEDRMGGPARNAGRAVCTLKAKEKCPSFLKIETIVSQILSIYQMLKRGVITLFQL